MAKPLFLECMECGHQQPCRTLFGPTCEACGSDWMQAHYDYASFKLEILRGLLEDDAVGHAHRLH